MWYIFVGGNQSLNPHHPRYVIATGTNFQETCLKAIYTIRDGEISESQPSYTKITLLFLIVILVESSGTVTDETYSASHSQASVQFRRAPSDP